MIHQLMDQRIKDLEDMESGSGGETSIPAAATGKKKDWQQTLRTAVTVARTEVNKTAIINFVRGCFVAREV